MEPTSCDTFVVLPPLTAQGVVFGKNSDRPQGEVQEVIYIPKGDNSKTFKCTYIEVECEKESVAVILSKPGWMWGAEMGANFYNVVIGNEAVWSRDTNNDSDPSVKRLLGMDLVRLGLQYSKTADEALETITKFLQNYGQGGPCSNTDVGLCYQNSFLIADPHCAWVLETVGKHWAAEKVTEGFRNISNAFSITTKIDCMSDGLLEYAKNNNLWDGEGDFNFAETFSSDRKPGCERQIAGSNLLSTLTESENFNEKHMFSVLRDLESGICRSRSDPFPTQGSQVSVLNFEKISVHWFTATPDPTKSVFKPFIFTPNINMPKYTICPEDNKTKEHLLYNLHEQKAKLDIDPVLDLLRSMEEECVLEISDLMKKSLSDINLYEFDELFKDCVETEVKFCR